MLANNLALPTLPALAARSTWAILLAAAVTLANVIGIDLMAFLAEVGAGATTDEVIATGEKAISAWQAVAPLIFGIWAWVERRAPNFRLSLGSGKTDALVFALAIGTGLLLGGAPVATASEVQVAQCLPAQEVVDHLIEDFGERIVSGGATSATTMVFVTVNDETGSWTIVELRDDRLCVLSFGRGWADTTGEPV